MAQATLRRQKTTWILSHECLASRWDAFLAHSIVEPQLPENLRTDPAINVSYGAVPSQTSIALKNAFVCRKHCQTFEPRSSRLLA